VCFALTLRLSNSELKKFCNTIIFPVVLYGCETWSLALREELRLRSFLVQDAEENIWTEGGRSDRMLEETA
jgi:hypothetical protein